MPRAPVTTAREALTCARGALRLALVADTHGNPHARAAERIAAERPDAILHAGDIGDFAVLDRFAEIAPVFAVRGNIDARLVESGDRVPDVRVIDVRDGDRVALTILLLHIAVYGPRLRADAARRARAEGAQLVVCGHSHVPFAGVDRGITVFNPGSIGPRRFQLPIVFGVFELAGGAAKLRHVDCETGATWVP